MGAPPGFDVEGVHYGPKPGVKSTWTKRNIMQDLGEICGFSVPNQKPNFGSVPEHKITKITDFLGLDTRRLGKKEKLKLLGDECGFEYAGRYGCLDKDQLWLIHQNVKERTTEGDSAGNNG